MAHDVRRHGAPLMLILASGFAGLGYQIVWTEQCALWLGHEAAAVLAVVAAFFGGLSVGALLLARRIEKSHNPVRWYAACELVIALWSVLLIALLPAFSAAALGLTGVQPRALWQWWVAFGGTFVLLLPATAAMGATLPAMARIVAERSGRSIAALYAGNTFGAVLGVLASAFWLVPALGLVRTALTCGALNIVCAVTSLAVFPAKVKPAANLPARDRAGARAAVAHLAMTGFLGIGYEVLVVRVLSQVTENTVYTFAVLLAVYLVGTATGAAVYQRWLSARLQADKLTSQLLGTLSAVCLLGTVSLFAAEQFKQQAVLLLGRGVSAAIAAEALPALFAFGPATLIMGALFSHLSQRAQECGVGFGLALGVNTLGAATAPVVFGVLAAPAIGAKSALILVSGAYLALIGRPFRPRALILVPAGAGLCMLLFAPRLAFVEVPPGGRVVSYEDGVIAAVSVVEDADGVSRLRINNRAQEGSSATQRVDGRQAWLPLLLHPAPQRALFLGLGTGVTAASAAEDPTLYVDAVELLPEVIRAATFFSKSVADGAAFPRLHVRAGDARHYVRVSDQLYDVIVSDNFHPARSGSGSLYTVEHFEAVRLRLLPGGVFCQWLPLHQLDLGSLKSIVRSFVQVYPEASAVIASNSLETPVLGLVGRGDALRFDPLTIRTRLTHAALREHLASIGFEDELAVLGSFVAGATSLGRFAEGAPANTDDRPVVAYGAPWLTYAPDSTPADRFIDLLRKLSVDSERLIVLTPDSDWPRRLKGYWAARTQFIESGRNVRPSANVVEMLRQVRDPLLAVLRTSPDFRPAYDPLLMMAAALARSDVSSARGLLAELVRIQSKRTEAAQLLSQLSHVDAQGSPH